MTKLTFLIAMGLSALSVPAFAQHAHHGAYAPMVGASDPCILGTNVQPGTCVGPVRVAPMIMSHGGVQSQPVYAQPVYTQPVYVQPVPYTQPTMMAPIANPPVPMPMPISGQMSGCISGYSGPSVPCNGVWVPAPGYMPQPILQQAPHYMPSAVSYAPQPQQVGAIPTSFFTGGITYGAGFPADSTYSYGGGGFGYSSGGTRFSGVRERSPTPLVAPPRRQRHAPPPAHHHGCC